VGVPQSDLTLVAFAKVKGSDGSLLLSNGFMASQRLSAGMYLLTLSDDLAQDPTWNSDGIYPDLLMFSIAGNNTMMIGGSHANQKQITTAILSADKVFSDCDHNVLVYRPTRPLTT
jgi:hypothetical protein